MSLISTLADWQISTLAYYHISTFLTREQHPRYRLLFFVACLCVFHRVVVLFQTRTIGHKNSRQAVAVFLAGVWPVVFYGPPCR